VPDSIPGCGQTTVVALGYGRRFVGVNIEELVRQVRPSTHRRVDEAPLEATRTET